MPPGSAQAAGSNAAAVARPLLQALQQTMERFAADGLPLTGVVGVPSLHMLLDPSAAFAAAFGGGGGAAPHPPAAASAGDDRGVDGAQPCSAWLVARGLRGRFLQLNRMQHDE